MTVDREFLLVLLVFCAFAAAGCDSCSDSELSPPMETATSDPLSLDCVIVADTGDALGNAAAAQMGLAVAGARGQVHLVTEAGFHSVDLHAKDLGGAYAHDDRFYILDFGADRIFSLDGDGTVGQEFQVGIAPRVMAFGDRVARVVSRDPDRPIVDVNLDTGTSSPVTPTGSLAADVEWHKGSFHEAWIYEGKVGSVRVADEPFRLHAARSGLYAMHAASATLSRVPDGRSVSLAGPITKLEGDLVALVAGSGKVQVVKDMGVVLTREVPVGASDLAVMGGGRVAAVSGGNSGKIHLVSLDSSTRVAKGSVAVPFSVGRLYPWNSTLWAIGPKSGRVARCTLK